MKRLPILITKVSAGLLALTAGSAVLAGCGTSPASQPRAPAASTPAASTPAPSGSTPSPGGSTPAPGSSTPARTPAAAAGPVWPIEPRTIPAVAGRGLSVLKEIRAGRHGGYERLVLEFTAPYGTAKVGYVPVVREDPSDRVVALQGRSFLVIAIQGAVAGYAATPITPYAGPSTLTPGYPTLRQASISGDFEAVLSFGVGLSRTAGFRVQRLTAPDRLVLDVAEPPAWRMWPEDSLAQARAEQAAFDQGHQPWRGSPEWVAQVYALAVYGWNYLRGGLDITPVPDAPGYTFRLAAKGSSASVTVRAVPVFDRANSIAAITDTR
jgi:hypothetical protein